MNLVQAYISNNSFPTSIDELWRMASRYDMEDLLGVMLPEERLDENGHVKPQKLTESGVLSVTDENFTAGLRQGMYGLINDMMMSEALNDDRAQFKLASEYFKNKFLVEEFFKPV